MSIKIHHGAPGSYKTAGAVKDDLIPAILEGRTIVTNVRGLTTDSVYDAIPDAPQGVEVISIDTSSREGREKLERWFHWVPIGCFIIIDEAQSIFRKSWNQKYLDSLDYPDGIDAAARDNRPKDWLDAWDMHRHYNWDIVMTTPAIKKIRDDIREASEFGYKHKDLSSIIPFMKGYYIEGMHLKDDNGTSPSNFINVVRKRIKSNDITWKLYKSTATGEHKTSSAGSNLLKSPKIMGLLLLVIAMFGYSFRDGSPISKLESSTKTSGSITASNGQVLSDKDFDKNGDISRYSYSNVQRDKTSLEQPYDYIHPFIVYKGFLTSSSKHVHLFTINGSPTTGSELYNLGYSIRQISPCAVELELNGIKQLSICSVSNNASKKKLSKPIKF